MINILYVHAGKLSQFQVQTIYLQLKLGYNVTLQHINKPESFSKPFYIEVDTWESDENLRRID